MKTTAHLAREAGERKRVAIAAECDIPLSWITKFMYGEFKNPSVNRVQFLYEKLTGTALLS